MTEIVYINLPAPEEPRPGMAGMEILHGFLGEFHSSKNDEVRKFVDAMCLKWNVHYRSPKQGK